MLHSILANFGSTFWLPMRASTVAKEIDDLFYLVYWVTVIFFVIVMAMTVVFAFKYRHRRRETTARESTAGHSTALELTWTIIPTLITIVIFYQGFRSYLALAIEPPNGYEITVNGKMWSWSFIYPNGVVSNELHIPADTPIRLILTSDDVIHSLFIPDFRTKKDVVPGRFNRMWVQAYLNNPSSKQPEEHDIFCAEYCGIGHSLMHSKAVVHEQADFKKWLEEAANWEPRMSPIKAGEQIYLTRGCSGCHSINGSIITGPTWKDMFGSQVALSDGQTITADEAYVRESVLVPSAKIVKGFQNLMPSYLGSMKERDVNALIAYMKSISKNYHGDLTSLNQITKTPSKNGGNMAK